jgi:LysM repeat protein
MRSFRVITSAGLVLALAALAACGGGDGSASTTLVPLGPTNFATIPPVDPVDEDSTTSTTGVDNPVPQEETYTVQSGEGLYSIAQKFDVTAEEIAQYNDWEDGIAHMLYPGTEIKIPGGARDPSSNSTTTTVGTEDGTYVVQAGDYLSGIAAKFDTTAQAIADANGWSDGINHAIFPGDVIQLP